VSSYRPPVPRYVAAVRLIVNEELTDRYAALSMSTWLTADEDPSVNTTDPLTGT